MPLESSPDYCPRGLTFHSQFASNYFAPVHIPPMSTLESTGVLGMGLRKRKFEGVYHATSNSRLRPDELSTLASTTHTPVRSMTRQSGLPQGTHRNPLEIESSPETKPKSRTVVGSPNKASLQLASMAAAGLIVQRNEHIVRQPKYYAVAGGHAPGIYNNWADVEAQIKGFPGAKQQKFDTESAALDYLEKHWDIVRVSLDRQNLRLTHPVAAPATMLQQSWGTNYPQPSCETTYPQPSWETSHLHSSWVPNHPQSEWMPNHPHTSWETTFSPPRVPNYPQPSGAPHYQLSEVPNYAQPSWEMGYPQPAWESSYSKTPILSSPLPSPQKARHLSPRQQQTKVDLTDTSTHLKTIQSATSANPPQPPRTEIIAAEPEPVLSSEQREVVDLILQGHNVFYTGSAGCGKSTILKAFVRELSARHKRVKIVAPTNLAALNVNGFLMLSGVHPA